MVLARAETDVERGDLGSARRRLASFIASAGYTPEILTRAAEISMQMRDPVQAGRYWLLTPAEGVPVEGAIEVFALACHHNPQQMASELPRFKLRHKVASYPEVVQSRLKRFGIDHVFEQQDPDLVVGQPAGWRQKAKALGCLLLVLALPVALVFVIRAALRTWCG
jgi:hypothetical protein